MENYEFYGRPWYQSYEVCKDFFAGEYPGDKYGEKAEKKIAHMVRFGVKHFIDLTDKADHLNPYDHLLPEDVTYTRFPITDVSVPDSVEKVHELLKRIDSYRSQYGTKIYLHCWGGVGRTGTIVACYFALHSSNPSVEESLAFLRKRFSKMPKSSHRITPETAEQVAFIGKYVEYVKRVKAEEKCELVHDSIRGCLMAGAMGDALGYTVEFMSRNYILSKYGSDGITLFELDNKGKALISDDTQMTLFTANGLLKGTTQCSLHGGGSPHKYVNGAYLDWYYTQTGNKKWLSYDDHYTWLRDLPEMDARRAPGTTCLSACESLCHDKPVDNYSKGCGGIMRVAPIGLLEAACDSKGWLPSTSWKDLAEKGGYAAEVTHCHPLGFLPAALFAVLIRKLTLLPAYDAVARMEELVHETIAVLDDIYLDESDDELLYKKYSKEKTLLRELCNRAIRLSHSNLSDAEAIRQLGEGWVADEAWAIALYCSMRHIDSVKDAIIASVNHDGDSDSTGSITGNIMGAIYGYKAIKEQNLFCPEGHDLEDTLELSEIILTLADDLNSVCLIGDYVPIDTPETQQWHERYCEQKPAGIGDCKLSEPWN